MQSLSQQRKAGSLFPKIVKLIGYFDTFSFRVPGSLEVAGAERCLLLKGMDPEKAKVVNLDSITYSHPARSVVAVQTFVKAHMLETSQPDSSLVSVITIL